MKTTEERTEIYGKRTEDYDRELIRLQRWGGSARNKELIALYHRHLFAKGCKKPRVTKLSCELRKIADYIRKDFDGLDSNDIEGIVAWVNQRTDYTELTKSDYRRCLKSFFRWFEDQDARLRSQDEAVRQKAQGAYRYLLKYVKCSYGHRNLDYATIITDEDCRKLIADGCQNAVEKATVAVLHETGCRAGEFLGIRIRDVEMKDNYAMLRLYGKTGERRVPIIQCVPWVMRWLDEHPDKHNPAALMWVSKHNGFRNRPIRYVGLNELLKRVYRRAGINKRCNPHWLRHSRATLISPHYSEPVLCKIMGWTLGSVQVRTYVHIGAGQVEQAFLTNNGLSNGTKPEPKVVTCVCGVINTPDARYCHKCGKALSVANLLEDQEKVGREMDKTIELLMDIIRDPNLRRKFEEFRRGPL